MPNFNLNFWYFIFPKLNKLPHFRTTQTSTISKMGSFIKFNVVLTILRQKTQGEYFIFFIFVNIAGGLDYPTLIAVLTTLRFSDSPDTVNV